MSRSQRDPHRRPAGDVLPPELPWTPMATLRAIEEALGSRTVGLDRRDVFRLGGMATLVAHVDRWTDEKAEALSSALDGGRLSANVLCGVAAAVDNLRYLDAEIGSGDLVDVAIPQLSMIRRMLRASRYDEATARRLYQTASDLAGLIGWFLVDSGRPVPARRYFVAALRASHTADDPVVGAEAVSFMAVHAYSDGDPRDASRLAEAARRRVRHRGSGLLDAMLLTRQARGYATAGDAAACRSMLGMAFDRFADGPSDRDPDWLYWMTDGEMHGQAGSCALELGDYQTAVEHYQQAYDAYDEVCVRDRALCLIRKGRALVYLGEAEHGHTETLAALRLAEHMNSTRLADHVRQFGADLAQHGPAPLVREFRERAVRYLPAPGTVTRDRARGRPRG